MNLVEKVREFVRGEFYNRDSFYGSEPFEAHVVPMVDYSIKLAKEKEVDVELVKKCILNHRGSIETKRESVEEQIIAEADALSNFDNVVGIFNAALVYEKKTQAKAVESVMNKLDNKYEQFSPEGKELVREKYEAAKVLFGGRDEN